MTPEQYRAHITRPTFTNGPPMGKQGNVVDMAQFRKTEPNWPVIIGTVALIGIGIVIWRVF